MSSTLLPEVERVGVNFSKTDHAYQCVQAPYFLKMIWEYYRFTKVTPHLIISKSLTTCRYFVSQEKNMWEPSRNFTSKHPENQTSHCYVLRNLDTLFWCTFQNHSHDSCLLCVFSEGLQKVENRSNLMCKSEQTVCPSKSLWQRIETQINFSVTDNSGLWCCLGL